jgi:siroheme synthase-like protein
MPARQWLLHRTVTCLRSRVDQTYYPVFLDLVDRPCLVVGGGPIACGKVQGLIDAGARVTVVAPRVDARIAQWHADQKCAWHARPFLPEDIGEAFVVIAATDDRALNAFIYQLANRQNRLANAVDDTGNCNFIAPAIARAGPIQVAVSTSGASPALAKQLRDEIQRGLLTPQRARTAEFLGGWRTRVKAQLPTYQERMLFWESVLASEIPGLLANDQQQRADEVMQAMIARATTEVVQCQ